MLRKLVRILAGDIRRATISAIVAVILTAAGVLKSAFWKPKLQVLNRWIVIDLRPLGMPVWVLVVGPVVVGGLTYAIVRLVRSIRRRRKLRAQVERRHRFFGVDWETDRGTNGTLRITGPHCPRCGQELRVDVRQYRGGPLLIEAFDCPKCSRRYDLERPMTRSQLDAKVRELLRRVERPS